MGIHSSASLFRSTNRTVTGMMSEMGITLVHSTKGFRHCGFYERFVCHVFDEDRGQRLKRSHPGRRKLLCREGFLPSGLFQCHRWIQIALEWQAGTSEEIWRRNRPEVVACDCRNTSVDEQDLWRVDSSRFVGKSRVRGNLGIDEISMANKILGGLLHYDKRRGRL